MKELAQAPLYGLLAEFAGPGELVAAARRMREEGFRHWDAHCPFPVHGLAAAMGLERSRVPWFVLVLGLAGAAAGMALQGWVSAVAYPLVVSGKPLFSWPAFIPITFECAVLGGALGAVVGFLRLARLPRPHHALFESRRFERATDDAFFLSVEARDPRFDAEGTPALLRELGARLVEEVRG